VVTPVTHFVLRNGGLMVLYHLCLAGESGGVFPPVDPVWYQLRDWRAPSAYFCDPQSPRQRAAMKILTGC
jgi:hypothetical protein